MYLGLFNINLIIYYFKILNHLGAQPLYIYKKFFPDYISTYSLSLINRFQKRFILIS